MLGSRSGSEVGVLSNLIARAYDKIKPGNALMYYPEANVLVPRHLDPASRTPAFKNVVITVESAVPDAHVRLGTRRRSCRWGRLIPRAATGCARADGVARSLPSDPR